MEKNGKHPLNDQRGKKSPANKMVDDELSFIVDHIMSFPRVESHYCRSSTNKQYLSSDLNISKMHVLYQQKCLEKQVKSHSLERYRMEFKKLNLSFHKPKKDVSPHALLTNLKVNINSWQKMTKLNKKNIRKGKLKHAQRKNETKKGQLKTRIKRKQS